MDLRMVYMTAGGLEEARRIARELVESRLAACVNIIDGMNSFYWWEGKIQDDKETVLIAKTKVALVPSLIEKVKSLHSYTVPCIVTLPILEGHAPFLKWVNEETGEPQAG
jgi:periplasmic divalent cation tolerance protein